MSQHGRRERLPPDLNLRGSSKSLFLVPTICPVPDVGLCYNAAIMEYPFRFANDNNNDNDDPRIVGRSFAG